MDIEIEYELFEVENVLEGYILVADAPEYPSEVTTGRERSNWQHAATHGKLCRQRQWRWCGRLAANDLRTIGVRQWRRP